jgi:two-component system, cell cycle sensor histidine kinase and response regulator CckA
MSQKLRVLYLEDNSDDFMLVQRELLKAGWSLSIQQVDNEHDFTRNVRDTPWDIILADFNLPGYGGMAALDFVRRSGYELPFILISGTIGEDAAVDCMRAGANDYVLKDNLRRLNLAITRELGESAMRRDRRRSEEERAKLETKLRQAQKMEAMGRLAGGIAHDFNNILTAILGHAEIASLQLEDHPAKTNLEQVTKASERARDLVQQILAFSRQRPAEKKVMMLENVVTEATKLLRATIPAAVTISVSAAHGGVTILADPSQIHQILVNLGTNAAHAMKDRGGRLEVALDTCEVGADLVRQFPQLRAGPHACLSVSDSGCGMDAATLERLFEPFFTTKEPGEGTGLGLAVVHGIVQSHDGAISVESRPGAGTTFRIFFPVVAAAAAQAKQPAAPPMPRGKGELVLFVDDEASVLALAEAMLKNLGYTTKGCAHPEQALEVFREHCHEISLVVTDLSMPGMSGLDFAREVLKIHPSTKVILTSGYTGDLDQEQCGRLGFRALLSKPFPLRVLAETVAGALA